MWIFHQKSLEVANRRTSTNLQQRTESYFPWIYFDSKDNTLKFSYFEKIILYYFSSKNKFFKIPYFETFFDF